MSGIVHLISSDNPSRASEVFAHSKALSLLNTSKNISIHLKHQSDEIAINIRGGEAFVRVSGGKGKVGWTIYAVTPMGIGVLLADKLEDYGQTVPPFKTTRFVNLYDPDPSVVEQFILYSNICGVSGIGESLYVSGYRANSLSGLVDYANIVHLKNGSKSTPITKTSVLLDVSGNPVCFPHISTRPSLIKTGGKTIGYTFLESWTTSTTLSPTPQSKEVHVRKKQYVYDKDGVLVESTLLMPTIWDCFGSTFWFCSTDVKGVGAPYISGYSEFAYVVSASSNEDAIILGNPPYSLVFYDKRADPDPITGYPYQIGQEFSFVPNPYFICESQGVASYWDLGDGLEYSSSRDKLFRGSIAYVGNGVYLAVASVYPSYFSSGVEVRNCCIDIKSGTVSRSNKFEIPSSIIGPGDMGTMDGIVQSLFVAGAGVAAFGDHYKNMLSITFNYGETWTTFFNTFPLYDSYRNIKFAVDTHASPSQTAFGTRIVAIIGGANDVWDIYKSDLITPTSTEIIWTKVTTTDVIPSVLDIEYTGTSTSPDILKLLDADGVKNGV